MMSLENTHVGTRGSILESTPYMYILMGALGKMIERKYL